MPAEEKFPECPSCKWFFRKALNTTARCRACDTGEFYEPRVDDSAPTDNELMYIFARMPNDQD